ncbi:MAG: AraC family transcriptional regulator [Clostridia bacterium]|nr:AraC family transcriptional regulator [Clostridia bacterium]
MLTPSITQFDVEITSVLLAHRYTIEPGIEMDAYRRGRNMHGIVCPISGSGMFMFNHSEIVYLKPGEIALLPASSAYRMRSADAHPFEHYTVNFLGRTETLPDWIPRNSMYVLQPNDPALFLARFQELVEIWQRMRIGFRMHTKARLLSLLAEYLSECITQNVEPGAYNRILPARRLMETSYAQPLTIEQLAGVCNMNKGAFRRIYTQVYGRPPIAHLLDLRIEKAKELLLIGLSLEDTAMNTGFSDVNYFIRYFKKTTGITPGHFRNMY